MATTARDTTTLVKERRGISPPNARTTDSQRSTKQTPTASTGKVKSPQSATTAPKHVPNYLRPTVSSRSESFKYVKKSTGPHEETTQKPNPLRRRSLEKPPLASRGDKAIISPGPARERVKTVTSSSLSHKTTTSPKSVVDKISKTPKAVKSQLPISKSIKKTPSPSIKKETNASASRKASSSHDVEQTLNLETKQEDVEPVVHEVEEMVNVESEVQVPCDKPKSENKEHVDVVDAEVNNVEDEKLKPSDVSTVTSEDLNVPQPQAVEIEKTEEKSHEEKTKTQHESEENHSKDENNESPPEESLASEAKIEAEEEGEENASEKAASSEETGDENKVEVKEQTDEGSEGVESKEGQQVEGGVEEEKPEPANVVSKRQGGQGKKESPAAYNDVIEETASKLLEKRKNKVKALVGAFETVIDYESSSK